MSDMEFEKSPQPYGNHQAPVQYEPGEGCLTTVIRIPVRIVVLIIVLPVRMVWDLLVICGRAVHRELLRPLGRALARLGRMLVVIPLVRLFEKVLTPLALGATWLAVFLGKALFVWPWVALWTYLVVPVVRYGVVVPLVWIYRQLLTPLGHGLAWLTEHLLVVPARWIYRRLLSPAGRGLVAVLGFLGKALFVWPWVALWTYLVVPVVRYGVVVPLVWIYQQLLTPLGHGIVWLLRAVGGGLALVGRGVWVALVRLVLTLLVTPVAWVYRRILAPVGREIAVAIGVAWRMAGHLSHAVGRALKWLAWNLAGRPARWFYQCVCTPVGHVVRDGIWRPAKQAAVGTGRAVRAALRSAGETVRQARRDAWRALVGGPSESRPAEPDVRRARTLGSATTVSRAAPEPEISLHKQG